MKTALVFKWIERNYNSIKSSAVLMIMLFMPTVYGLVYLTGGPNVYTHSMYVPILIGSLVFGIKGGIVVGLVAGFTLGPFMPLDSLTMEPQKAVSWIYRSGFFVIMGVLCGAFSDSIKRYLKHLKWFTRHDTDTGLPNRSALMDDLKILKSKGEGAKKLAVISIENALELEVTFGPDVTGGIIKKMASEIVELLGDKTEVYRISTYLLAILLFIDERDDNKIIRHKLMEKFRSPVSFKGISLHADIRAGYTDLSMPEQEPIRDLQEAEAALRSACERAHSWAVYTPDLDHGAARENLELLGELKEAVDRKQLTLHYQPKVSLDSGVVLGVEALMRWSHPKLGNVPPGKFIPRAEQSTLIDMLTEWAIDNALAQLVEWKKKGIELSVAVNISTRNLLQPDFAARVLKQMDTYKLNGGSLELEVTEWALMKDIRHSFANISKLSKAGVVFSIDDFGTGYASLEYLKDFPASSIKIDQVFIREIWGRKRPGLIVESSVNMAHLLEIKAVAEGVEDIASYKLLCDLGCDVAQGYFISRPVPAPEFAEWYMRSGGIFKTYDRS